MRSWFNHICVKIKIKVVLHFVFSLISTLLNMLFVCIFRTVGKLCQKLLLCSFNGLHCNISTFCITPGYVLIARDYKQANQKCRIVNIL